MLVAVGIENHRALAETRLKAIGIELGLLLAYPRVLAGALGLDQPQRLSVRTPQHVIDETNALIVRHAFDAELGIV